MYFLISISRINTRNYISIKAEMLLFNIEFRINFYSKSQQKCKEIIISRIFPLFFFQKKKKHLIMVGFRFKCVYFVDIKLGGFSVSGFRYYFTIVKSSKVHASE